MILFNNGSATVAASTANPFPVTCISGCSGGGGGGGTSSMFGATFPSTGTAAGFVDNSGNMAGANLDSMGNLLVNVAAGGASGGTSSNFGAAFPGPGTAAGFIDAGGNMAGGNLDAGGNLLITFSNTTIGVTGTFWQATQPVSGTFWQATQPVSGAISFTAPQHTICDSGCYQATQPVSGTFWQATQPVSGTFWQATQPVSGSISFTAPQHVILDSGTTTVTQATGTNLHAVLDTTSTTAVTQATGTNLHAVLDTTSTTAVTQATASNLNAAVVGTGTAGSAASGVVTVQGIASMTKLLVTPDANSAVNVAQVGGTAVVPDPCTQVAKTYAPFSLASTTALKIFTKATGKNWYICSINIVSAAANNVALIAGTHGSVDCDTSTAGLAGGTTAAAGWNFAANGGLTEGNGAGSVAATASTGLDVCLLASGSGQLSGVVTGVNF